MFDFIRKRFRCEFWDTCELRKDSSYTCNTGGGPYCGKWRKLKTSEVK